MGMHDLPAPLLDLVDRELLGALPPLAHLIMWAIAAAILSLTLYRWLSPQQRIAETKAAALSARRRLNAHDGDLESALPLMRQSIALSPVLALLVWLDGAYSHDLPAVGATPTIAVEPQAFGAQWQPSGSGGQI